MNTRTCAVPAARNRTRFDVTVVPAKGREYLHHIITCEADAASARERLMRAYPQGRVISVRAHGQAEDAVEAA